MREIVLILLLFVAWLPGVQGLTSPNVTFIPPQISAGASFIALAKGDAATPARVTWIVPAFAANFGSFPKIDGTFRCYFSNTDPAATCGPTPFTIPTVGFNPMSMLLETIDQSGATANTTIGVNVGGITLNSIINVVNTTVAITIQPSGDLPDSVTFAVYYQNASMYSSGYRPLVRDPFTGYWLGNDTLPGGDYYIAFTANSAANFGGNVVTVSIPVKPVAVACTAPQQPPPAAGSQVQADAVNLAGILINPGEHYEKTGLSLTNSGNGTLSGLSVAMPANFSQFVSISLEKTILAPNDTTIFTVAVDNVMNTMTINTVANIVSQGVIVGKVPLFIPVTVIGSGGGGTCPGSFTIQPDQWTGEFVVGTPAANSFTLSGPGPLTGLTYTATGSVKGIETVTFPTTGTATVTLDPLVPGKYEGSVVIDSSAGSRSIFIAVEFFGDITEQVSSLRDDVDTLQSLLTAEQQLLLSDTLTSLDASIASAEADTASGNYRSAEQSLVEAQAQYAALSSISSVQPTASQPAGGGGGVDITTALIVIVILIGGLVAVFVFRKKKRSGKIEEELDDELEEAMT